MPYAGRHGLRLYYQQAGTGPPPFVFVHGWCCDHTFFQPPFEYFRASHSVTVLDLRGCGRSDQPESGYDIPTLADDVAWLCGKPDIQFGMTVGAGHFDQLEVSEQVTPMIERFVRNALDR